MDTPICDFATEYCLGDVVRFHMPGHKGVAQHGMEAFDLTEIKGADYLYSPHGIIAQSEKNCSLLFGTEKTLYATEGSSLSIKTMLAIAVMNDNRGGRPLIVSTRNCHKAFLNAGAFLDFDVFWVYPKNETTNLCASSVQAEDIENALSICEKVPTAVYITSPDYLGNIADVEKITNVCKKYNTPLLVDNAHGAYLKFLPKSLHPIDLGATMCCDSAHKTLPVYTGGSYLHISHNAPGVYAKSAKEIMSMFSSTSPSYLIMQSMDNCNRILSDEFPQKLIYATEMSLSAKNELRDLGYSLLGGEPLKLTIFTNAYGYSGDDFADLLREEKIECEYSDFDCVVLMASPYNTQQDFDRLVVACANAPRRKPIDNQQIRLPKAETKMSIRQAVFSRTEDIPVDESAGRICGKTVVSCQPSIPIVCSGEEISENIIKILKRYSIFSVNVVYLS